METSKKEKLILSNVACIDKADHLAFMVMSKLCRPKEVFRVYGVPRGGLIPAYMLVDSLRKQSHNAMALLRPWANTRFEVVDSLAKADVVIDDIVDSGTTRERILAKLAEKGKEDVPFVSLYEATEDSPWYVFPWEVGLSGEDDSADDIVIRLLQYIGEDPSRGGLLETPKRVLKAWNHWASGYTQNPAEILKTFEDGASDEMVIVRDIEFYSQCEHHMAPFFGKAHIAYIPNGKIVGLSKLARLTDCFARRLQVQERLTTQIADAILEHLDAKGVAVVVEARHMCMMSRGVQKQASSTVTSALRGVYKDDPAARAEVLSLINRPGN